MTTYTLSYFDGSNWIELLTWDRPFNLAYKLDETLDIGELSVNATPYIKLKPFTPVSLRVAEDGEEIDKYVWLMFYKENEQLSMT